MSLMGPRSSSHARALTDSAQPAISQDTKSMLSSSINPRAAPTWTEATTKPRWHLTSDPPAVFRHPTFDVFNVRRVKEAKADRL